MSGIENVSTSGATGVQPIEGRRWRASSLRDYGVLFSTIALFIALSIASPVFLTKINLLNLLEQQAALGIIACGATLVILAGGFDLSSGAVYALAGVLGAKVAAGGDVLLGILVGFGVGIGCGAINGFATTVGRINSLVGTLASAMIIRGIALAVTAGFAITVPSPHFRVLGQNEILGLKVSIWILIAFAAVTWFLLAGTRFGRHVYAAGGNEEAARLSGVRVNLIRAITFGISGLAAGIAAMIVVSRVGTAQADIGTGLELSAIAAVVVGGTSISGGEGSIWRTLLGLLFLALIGNGFDLLNINSLYQGIFTGVIIMAAVGADAWTRRRAA